MHISDLDMKCTAVLEIERPLNLSQQHSTSQFGAQFCSAEPEVEFIVLFNRCPKMSTRCLLAGPQARTAGQTNPAQYQDIFSTKEKIWLNSIVDWHRL